MSDHHVEYIRYGYEIGWSRRSLKKAINSGILTNKVDPETFMLDVLFNVVYGDTVVAGRSDFEIIRNSSKSNTIIITI